VLSAPSVQLPTESYSKTVQKGSYQTNRKWRYHANYQQRTVLKYTKWC